MLLPCRSIGSIAALVALSAVPAEAAVILYDPLPVHVDENQWNYFDVNGDNTDDFGLYFVQGSGFQFQGISGSDQLLGDDFYEPVVFNSGDTASFYSSGDRVSSSSSDPASGSFSAFRFDNASNTSTYMGYIEWGAVDGTGINITSMAYQDVAGADIVMGAAVPEPSTWGAISAGCAGLVALVWRRRKKHGGQTS